MNGKRWARAVGISMAWTLGAGLVVGAVGGGFVWLIVDGMCEGAECESVTAGVSFGALGAGAAMTLAVIIVTVRQKLDSFFTVGWALGLTLLTIAVYQGFATGRHELYVLLGLLGIAVGTAISWVLSRNVNSSGGRQPNRRSVRR